MAFQKLAVIVCLKMCADKLISKTIVKALVRPQEIWQGKGILIFLHFLFKYLLKRLQKYI